MIERTATLIDQHEPKEETQTKSTMASRPTETNPFGFNYIKSQFLDTIG
jgi:hypothetical protein